MEISKLIGNWKIKPGDRIPDQKQKIVVFVLVLVVFLSIFSCNKEETPPPGFQATPYTIEIPRYFPTKLNIPADNPMTVEGIALGRHLFYDGRLSGRTHPDSLMSCATCHLQSRAFECGFDHPVYTNGRTHGLTGIYTPHYMLPLINLVWTNHGYLWNGKISGENSSPAFRNIEDLTWMSIVAPHEMAGDTNRTKALIQSIHGYPEMFEKAFGSPVVTVGNMGKAIAQFIRTLISSNSKFDRFLRGDISLTNAERNGYVLFMTELGADCFHCHGGEGNPLFTTHLFYNNGKDSVFHDPMDRFSVSGDPADIGAYKAPTLRNIQFTAPYMHDGRFQTLDEVLEFYNSNLVWSPTISPLMHHISTNGVRLTPSQLDDLKAFLFTLSDTLFLANPDFAQPVLLPGP